MEKVYLVIDHSVCNAADCGISIAAFKEYSEALEEFRAWVEEEKQYIRDGWSVRASEESFEAWEYGDWTNNHISVELRKQIVRK